MTPRLALMGLRIDGMSNLRDLGGTPTADGGRIQPGRLWRSENQTGLSADSRRAMIASGLTDVVDLRTSYECAASPSPFVDEPEVVYHQHSYFLEEIDAHADVLQAAVPWLGGDDFGTQTTDDGANSYLLFLALRPDSVLAALRAVAGASGAALVHCAVGRDRTGFTVALALALVGAPDEAIAADYAETSRHLEGVLRALWSDEAYAIDEDEASTMVIHTDEHTMLALLACLHAQPGGVEGVLSRLGWTPSDQAALRAHLLS